MLPLLLRRLGVAKKLNIDTSALTGVAADSTELTPKQLKKCVPTRIAVSSSHGEQTARRQAKERAKEEKKRMQEAKKNGGNLELEAGPGACTLMREPPLARGACFGASLLRL